MGFGGMNEWMRRKCVFIIVCALAPCGIFWFVFSLSSQMIAETGVIQFFLCQWPSKGFIRELNSKRVHQSEEGCTVRHFR